MSRSVFRAVAIVLGLIGVVVAPWAAAQDDALVGTWKLVAILGGMENVSEAVFSLRDGALAPPPFSLIRSRDCVRSLHVEPLLILRVSVY